MAWPVRVYYTSNSRRPSLGGSAPQLSHNISGGRRRLGRLLILCCKSRRWGRGWGAHPHCRQQRPGRHPPFARASARAERSGLDTLALPGNRSSQTNEWSIELVLSSVGKHLDIIGNAASGRACLGDLLCLKARNKRLESSHQVRITMMRAKGAK